MAAPLIPLPYDQIRIDDIFTAAGRIYRQRTGEKGHIYISTNRINGMNLAVFPDMDDTVFTEYNLADDADVQKLIDFRINNNINKTFFCSLCSLLEPNKGLLVSDEQNQLYLDPNNAPGDHIKNIITCDSGSLYTITATRPQYYYNHLLYTSSEHIPTYSLFMDRQILNDLLLFIRSCTQHSPNIRGFFNGSFGSDIYHFHVHLTSKTYPYFQEIFQQAQAAPTIDFFVYESQGSVVRMAVIATNDINRIFAILSDVIAEYLPIRDQNPNNVLSASFAYHDNKYFVCLQQVDRNVNTWLYNGRTYFAMPGPCTMSCDSMQIPGDRTAIDAFIAAHAAHYANYYIDPRGSNLYANMNGGKLAQYRQQVIVRDERDVIQNFPVEAVYMKLAHMITTIPLNEAFAIQIMDFITIGCIDRENACTHINMGKYKYLLGIAVTNMQIATLNTRYLRFRILGGFYFLREYLHKASLKSDYLYFKGNFAQRVIVNTISNFLRLTSAGTTNGINTETDQVNLWLNYIFKLIGEVSGYAIGNTESSLQLYDYNNNKRLNVDFVLKILRTGVNPTTGVDSTLQFRHEFFTSMSVNDIRQFAPNYVLCFGGFLCNTTDNNARNNLCNGGPNSFSYLMLENVKNSKTLSRVFKLPKLYSPNDVRDTIDIIYQVMIALSIGWDKKQFTHYDLHLDNIMQYDFISNTDYLKLFKIYNEGRGDEIPKIEEILFKYYIGGEIYIVPAKYLYVIIDYGFTYVNDMPANTSYTPNTCARWGCVPHMPNSSTDSYTFIVFFLFTILHYKPYLVFDTNGWIANELTTFFTTFFDNYRNLYTNDSNVLKNALFQTHRRNPADRRASFLQTYIENVNPNYRVLNYSHFTNSQFTYDAGAHPDFSSSQNIINWMRRTFYAAPFDENREETFVFNWGDVPAGVIPGITPNNKIRRLIAQKLAAKNQKITTVHNFARAEGRP